MSGFDIGQKSVLLCFVEAVHFVYEDDRAAAVAARTFRGGHDLLDFLDAGHNRAEGDEFGARLAAISRASVVLPQPGGPQRSMETISSLSI